MEDKPWKNEELRQWEEALPRLKECELEKVSRVYRAKTGVGQDGFHPKVLLDLTKETRGEIVEFLEKVEQSGKWPQQTCTTMFFLMPQGSLESARSGEVAAEVPRWLGRHRRQKWKSPTNGVGHIDGHGRRKKSKGQKL